VTEVRKWTTPGSHIRAFRWYQNYRPRRSICGRGATCRDPNKHK